MTRQLLDASPDAGVLSSLDGVILTCNTQTALRLNTSVSTLIGQNLYDLFPPNISDKFRQLHQEVIRTGQSAQVEVERHQGWNDVIAKSGQGFIRKDTIDSHFFPGYYRADGAGKTQRFPFLYV